MASLEEPFDPNDPDDPIVVIKRAADTLPDHVKGNIFWAPARECPTGYYLQTTYYPYHFLAVEFIDNYWYYLDDADPNGQVYASLNSCIRPNTRETGYWHIYDLEYPLFQPVPSTSAITLDILVEPQGGPLTDNPAISPFLTAANPQATYLENSSSEEDTDSTESPPPLAHIPLPLSRALTPLTPQEEQILAAQFEHVLDIQDREPENPQEPDYLGYLNLIEQALLLGLDTLEPPPLAEPEPLQVFQPLFSIIMVHQQQQQQAAAASAAPAVPLTKRINGTPPDTFTRVRANADVFMQQWKLYWMINDEHVNIQSPFKRVVTALHFIRGPNVNDWVKKQLTSLTNKVTHPTNPIGHGDEVLWNDFKQAFRAAFTDTTKKQTGHAKLHALKMRIGGLDDYIAAFEHLAALAGYDLLDQGVVYLFARNLERGLLSTILHCKKTPEMFAQWKEAARNELQVMERHHAMLDSDRCKYAWVSPHTMQRCNRHSNMPRCHPNDETVPMDVDPPLFTRVSRAYSDKDKQCYVEQGLCFRCGKKGHQARQCPNRKEQPFKMGQHHKKGTFGSPLSKPPFKQRSSPPKCTQGFRKSNKPKTGYFNAHVASIGEVDEEEMDEDEDIPFLAACTARLSEKQ